jgi:hypothetical protein
MKQYMLIGAVCAMVSAPAQAAVGSVQFNGVVLSNCTIVITTPGTLDLSADGLKLSSKEGLGIPGSATLLTTGAGYRVDVGTPTSFTLAPSGVNSGVGFATQYSATGVSAAVNVQGGITTALGIGVTNLSVNLTASRPAGFPAGIYAAQTTVTCE